MFARLRSLPTKKKERIQAISFLLPFGLIALTMLYGLLRWPMAPIREVADQYVDKAGTLFDEAAYRQFVVWQRCLVASFAIFFGSIFIVSWAIGLPFGNRRRTMNAKKTA